MNAAQAGDTILIHAGTYVERVLIQNKQGTANSWITIRPYNNDVVVLDGEPSGSYDGVFYLRGTSTTRVHYIHITGLEIRNSGYAGVFLYGDTQADVTNIHVENCEIHDCCSSGIYAYHATNVVFNNNNVYYVNHTSTVSGSDWPSQEGISFSGVYGFEIHHNTFSNGGKECIDIKSGSRNGSCHHNIIDNTQGTSFVFDHIGIYCDAFSLENYNIHIYNNYIFGSHGQGIIIGIERDGGRLHDIHIYNNIIDVTWASAPGMGIATYSEGTPSNRQIYNIHIYNNTIRTSSHNPLLISAYTNMLTGNILIENNIFTSTAAYAIIRVNYYNYDNTMIQLRNNLYYRYGGTTRACWMYNVSQQCYTTAGAWWGTNYQLGNPLFINPGTDFHLQETSPARDTGATVDLSFDYDNYPRPVNLYDIGAYEYGSGPAGNIDDTTVFTINVI